jgi:hypothetical protein
MSIKTHPYAYIDPVCGKPAFFRVAVPVGTDPVIAPDFERPNGTPMRYNDPVICWSCSRSLAQDLWDGKLVDPACWVRRDTLTTTEPAEPPQTLAEHAHHGK